MGEGRPTGDAAPLRPVLLGITLLGCAGLLGELALLEHTESLQQWLPFAGLGLGLLSGLLVAVRTTRPPLLLLRAAMVLVLALGLLGLWLHYAGNVAFEREIDPAAEGAYLVWTALRGATPAMAPGAMVQVGLLGLLYTWRHPRLGGRAARDVARTPMDDEEIR